MIPPPALVGPDADARGQQRLRGGPFAESYDSRLGLDRPLAEHAAARLLARRRGGRALQLGCADCVMTECLVGHFSRLDVVAAAEAYARQAAAVIAGRGRAYHCLFEEFEPDTDYDVVVIAGALEHVAEPRQLLSRAAAWLAPGGEIHIIVPNAGSLHRRLGMLLGLLDRVEQPSESDLAIGRRRVYTWRSLAIDITAAGLELIAIDGFFLKPLPRAALQPWPQAAKRLLFRLGALAPQLCSQIHAVAGLPGRLAFPPPALALR